MSSDIPTARTRATTCSPSMPAAAREGSGRDQTGMGAASWVRTLVGVVGRMDKVAGPAAMAPTSRMAAAKKKRAARKSKKAGAAKSRGLDALKVAAIDAPSD